MLKRIAIFTQKEARRVLGQNENDPEAWSVSIDELKAFIAILYIRGALGQSMNLEMLWSGTWGNYLVQKAMSRNRFKEIMRFLRFEDKATRSTRLRGDKFALFSDIRFDFIANAQSSYVPGPYITVDEQLFPSKCRCPFTQFMASKPDKYGQKYWMAVDKESNYVVNAFPYLGKDESRPVNERLADSVLKQLVGPYLNKGRNITSGVATRLPKGCSATPQTKWAAPVNRPDPRRNSMGGGSGLRAGGERLMFCGTCRKRLLVYLLLGAAEVSAFRLFSL